MRDDVEGFSNRRGGCVSGHLQPPAQTGSRFHLMAYVPAPISHHGICSSANAAEHRHGRRLPRQPAVHGAIADSIAVEKEDIPNIQ